MGFYADDRYAPQHQPPTRLKPNFHARLVRWACQNGKLVIAGAALVFAMGLALCIMNYIPASGNSLGVTPQPPSHVATFGRLGQLQSLEMSNTDPVQLSAQRDDLVASLRQRGELFEMVFSPGGGDFYDDYDLLFRPANEVQARVAYALSLKPLFNAVAASPDADSMVTLTSAISAAVDQGRDPQGLDDVLNEAANSVQALMKGEDKPVDWAKLADLGSDSDANSLRILALPRAGSEVAAAGLLAKAKQVLEASTQTRIALHIPPPPERATASGPVDGTRVAAASAIGIVFVGLLLALLIGNLGLSLVAFTPTVIVLPVCVAMSFIILKANWFSIWPVLAFAILCCNGLGFAFCLSATLTERNANPLERLMLAAHEDGTALAWLAVLFAVPFLAAAILGQAFALLVAPLAGAVSFASYMATLTLIPALISLRPDVLNWRARGWLVPAHQALFETGRWQVLSRILGSIAILGSVAVLVLEPKIATLPLAETPVSIVAKDQAEVDDLVSRLRSVPSAQAVQWLGSFLPDDIPKKREMLQRLQNQFPLISPVQRSDAPQDVRDAIDQMQDNLKAVAEAATARPQLKAAADALRRSLALLSATGDDDHIIKLENRLFGGFNHLSETADNLATLAPPSLQTLPDELQTLFGKPPGPFRLEVTPIAGVTPSQMAVTLLQAGFEPLHPAAAQAAEEKTRKSALIWVFGIAACIASLVMVMAMPSVLDASLAIVSGAACCVVLAALLRLWPGPWDVERLCAAMLCASGLLGSLYLSPLRQTSTLYSAVNTLLHAALAMAAVLPFELVGIGQIGKSILPAATGLALMAVTVALFQKHANHDDDALDETG